MKDNIILILKGFVLGIANVIPGVSGGTLAITLGIYERIIEILSNFRKNIKENIKFVLFLVIGLVIAILLFSNIIGYSLKIFPFATILFFIGFILGGIPLLFKKIKGKISVSNIFIFLFTFLLVILMTFISPEATNKSLDTINIGLIIDLLLCGVLGAASMILPGISGSFVLMLVGYYEPIINTISDLTRFNNIIYNVIILGVFGIGVLVGIISMAKLIRWLLKKYEIKTYYGIIGFVCASIISIFINVLGPTYGILQIVIGVILLFVGMFLSKAISTK